MSNPFYSPYMKGPDVGSGISQTVQNMLMMKILKQYLGGGEQTENVMPQPMPRNNPGMPGMMGGAPNVPGQMGGSPYPGPQMGGGPPMGPPAGGPPMGPQGGGPPMGGQLTPEMLQQLKALMMAMGGMR